jgi:uncharacterized protein HemX
MPEDKISEEEKELLAAKKETEEKKTELLGSIQKLILLVLGAAGVGGVGFGFGNMGDNLSHGETTKEAVIEVLEEKGTPEKVQKLEDTVKQLTDTVQHVHKVQQQCTTDIVEVKTKVDNVDDSIDKIDTRQREQTQLLYQIKGSLDSGGLHWFPPKKPEQPRNGPVSE